MAAQGGSESSGGEGDNDKDNSGSANPQSDLAERSTRVTSFITRKRSLLELGEAAAEKLMLDYIEDDNAKESLLRVCEFFSL